MKRILPAFGLSLLFILPAMSSHSQDTRAFAITAMNKGEVNWMAVRQINMTTGEETKLIYAPGQSVVILDAQRQQPLQQLNSQAKYKQIELNIENHIQKMFVTTEDEKKFEAVTAPTASLVAASAFDAKSNRLFFTPMRSNELRYFDLNSGTGQVFYVRNKALKTFYDRHGEADVITRMCIGADGYGYALTNDANHLIRFSTGDNISIVDLGSVKDGVLKNDISIRDMMPSWGGDMVADAFGNLWLISMNANVFKINLSTMTADNLGKIKGLPTGYTVNGAAVNTENRILISCASQTGNYFVINPADLEATSLPAQKGEVFNASDLASANILYSDAAIAAVTNSGSLAVFPNPSKDQLNIVLDGVVSGNYHLQLLSAEGSVVLNRKINVTGKTKTQIMLPAGISKGMYILKVFDANGKEYATTKIVVQ